MSVENTEVLENEVTFDDQEPEVEVTSKEEPKEAEPAPEVPVSEVEAQEPAYQPDYSYKVMGERKELPEWTRGLIKSKEDEQTFRDLFERAEGLHEVKRHRDELSEQMRGLREQYQPVVEQVQMAAHYFQQNDLDNVFRVLGIPENAVLKYSINKLQLQQNPQQAQLYNETVEQRHAKMQLENQNRVLQQQLSDHRVQQTNYHLDQELGRVSDVVSSFDSRFGAGAFREEVIKRGIAHYNLTGQDLSVTQAVSEVARIVAPPQAAAPQATQTLSPDRPKVVAPTEGKPALPTIKGNATSPARSEIRSIEDIRALARARNS